MTQWYGIDTLVLIRLNNCLIHAYKLMLCWHVFRQTGPPRRVDCLAHPTYSGFIPQVASFQKTLKNGMHSFPDWRSAHMNSVENKPASSLVVSLGKHLTGCLHLYVANRWRGQADYPSWWPSLTKDMQTEHERICIYKLLDKAL